MTVDTLILIGMSFGAYRRASRSGRSRWLWILIVWILGYAFGMLFAVVIVEMTMFAVHQIDLDFEVGKALANAFTRFGVITGGIVAVLAAGRPLNRPRLKAIAPH